MVEQSFDKGEVGSSSLSQDKCYLVAQLAEQYDC